MASKAEYLKRYLSGSAVAGDTATAKKKKKRRIKKHTNVIIHDDDVDWRTIVPKDEESNGEDDPGIYTNHSLVWVLYWVVCG